MDIENRVGIQNSFDITFVYSNSISHIIRIISGIYDSAKVQ